MSLHSSLVAAAIRGCDADDNDDTSTTFFEKEEGPTAEVDSSGGGGVTSASLTSYAAANRQLIQKNKDLKAKLEAAIGENVAKDALIQTLQGRLRSQETRKDYTKTQQGRNTESSSPTNETADAMASNTSPHTSTIEDDGDDPATKNNQNLKKKNQSAVEEMRRFLVMEARDVVYARDMVEAYVNKVIELNIPLDRFLCGCVIHYPEALAYHWKWEKTVGFTEKRIPKDVFDKLKSSNEPFALLYNGKMTSVRIHQGDETPYDSAWFKEEGYQDYLALPMTYKGRFMAGLAWATKCPGGFKDEDLDIFRELQDELSMALAHYIYDTGITYLPGVLNEEVADRTKTLASTNQVLEQRVVQQSYNQLRNFAMMSHEIRTPLNCIVGMSSLLLESLPAVTTTISGTDEGSLRDTARMIMESGELLAAVVNDVLDFSRLESANIDFEIQSVDLLSTLSTVVDSIRCKGNDKQVKVQTNYPSDLPKFIRTDARRLQQIMYNLIGNALKFSNVKSTVEVTVSVIVAEDRTSKEVFHGKQQNEPPACTILQISVKDYGRGIKEKDLEKIFEPFQRASSETERLYGGTGLGLALRPNW